MRDWDAELKKVDNQLEALSDKALIPASKDATPTSRVAVPQGNSPTSSVGVFARLLLSVALGIGMLFWPYAARCGTGLFGYLAATGVVAASGVWSAIWTWRHRAGRAHVLSLLILLWGLVLFGMEVLPRAGYAKPSVDHPAIWACQ
ncbi:MAG: hypothetical protein NVS4B3_10860 [Gemmatimonadaceae bacterium]